MFSQNPLSFPESESSHRCISFLLRFLFQYLLCPNFDGFKELMDCEWADASIKKKFGTAKSVGVTLEYVDVSFCAAGLCSVGSFHSAINRCLWWRHGRCFECRELALGRRPRALLGTQLVQIWSSRSSTAPDTWIFRYYLTPRLPRGSPAACCWF